MSSGIDPDMPMKEPDPKPLEGQMDMTGDEPEVEAEVEEAQAFSHQMEESVEKPDEQPEVKPDVKHKIDATLLGFATPIGEGSIIRQHPKNTRRGDVDAIADSYNRFGQLKPIVVQRSTMYIVAGNHSFLGAKQLGWTHIAAVFSEMDDVTARQYLLADNRAADKGTYSEADLAIELEDMQDHGWLDGTGYVPDDVDDLLASIGAVAETMPSEFQGGYAEDPEATQARYDPERRPDGTHIVHREFILAYPLEQYEEFVGYVNVVKRVYGVASARDVIFEVMRRQALDPKAPFDEEGLAVLLFQRQQAGMQPKDPDQED